MCLHVVHGHSHLFQLCHYRGVRAGRDCIGLCQLLHIVALCLHYLKSCLYVFDHIMVIFWRGRWCTVYVLHCCGVTDFSCGCYCSFLLLVGLAEKKLYFAHVLRLADCRLQSLMSSLKIPVCASRVIPFDIIIASEIVWPPDLAISLPFSNCSISRAREFSGVVWPHHINCIFLEVHFVDHPIAGE